MGPGAGCVVGEVRPVSLSAAVTMVWVVWGLEDGTFCLQPRPPVASAPQEAYIADLDAKSGASLKLTLLNPKGRIWTMVAGGGASVVYR